MKRRNNPLMLSEFQFVLMAMGFLVFSWPVIQGAASPITGALFSYLFITWAVLIGCLFFLHSAHGRAFGVKTDDEQ